MTLERKTKRKYILRKIIYPPKTVLISGILRRQHKSKLYSRMIDVIIRKRSSKLPLSLTNYLIENSWRMNLGTRWS
jgi:hypothetical protein